MYGIRSLLAIKPGVSLEVDVYFPICAASLSYKSQYFCVMDSV